MSLASLLVLLEAAHCTSCGANVNVFQSECFSCSHPKLAAEKDFDYAAHARAYEREEWRLAQERQAEIRGRVLAFSPRRRAPRPSYAVVHRSRQFRAYSYSRRWAA